MQVVLENARLSQSGIRRWLVEKPLNEKRHSVEDDTSGTDKVASDVNQNSGNFSPGKVSADSTALSNIGGNAQGSMYNVYINTGVALIAIITVATIIAVCALKEDKATATVVNVLHVVVLLDDSCMHRPWSSSIFSDRQSK